MSADLRLYLPNPSPPSMRAVQHFGRPSEPKVGVVQIHEFIRHPEWTYAR
jgi:hypothetical protein